MTEENTIDINIEQILAAILSNGKIIVKIEQLTADYGDYSVAVNQEEDGSLSFELVKVAEDESR